MAIARGTCLGVLAWCGVVWAAASRAEAPDPVEFACQIDEQLATELSLSGAATTRRCTDETYLRRVFLDLVGHPPAPEEVLAFSRDGTPTKRRDIVNRLLADDRFGANWAQYWRDVILYRRTEDRALIGAAALTEFLQGQFNENRSWSDTATALITASGNVRDNGAAGLLVAQAGTPEDVAAEVSRIFVGIQIQCAQCHDHPTDRWKREQFHHMAAFFPRIGVRLNLEDRSLIVTTTDFPRRRPPQANNRFFGTLEHHMPDKDDPAAPGTLMQPVFFLDEQRLPTGTRDADRRSTLARWLTSSDNPWFAKAFVNRLWSELTGEGFCEPVDDLGPDRECVAPQTFDYLAAAFTASGYDPKWLIRCILATDAYQRESRSRRSAESPAFAAACAQRLRSDQLFDSLLAALNLEGRLPPPRTGPGPVLRRDPRFQFAQIFGYDPSEPREDVAASVPQALALMNHPMFNQAMSARRPDGLGGILARNPDNRDALVALYLQVLGRQPTDTEQRTCLSYLRRVESRPEAFEDILWSLVNCTEFLYRK